MKYALYKGCLASYRIPHYERSARYVLAGLGGGRMVQENGCCGSQILESRNSDLWLGIAARNIAMAEKYDLDLLTLCGSCTSTLSRVKGLLENNSEKAIAINKILGKIGLEFQGKSRIVHILKLLAEEISISELKGFIKDKLNVKAAFQHPCQVYRPERIMNFNRDAVSDLLELFLADVYEMDACCGETLIASDHDVCLSILKQNLDRILKERSDMIITACGNCQMTYDVNQTGLKNRNEIYETVPSLLVTQALGLAMGYGHSDLGLSQNLIKLDLDHMN